MFFSNSQLAAISIPRSSARYTVASLSFWPSLVIDPYLSYTGDPKLKRPIYLFSWLFYQIYSSYWGQMKALGIFFQLGYGSLNSIKEWLSDRPKCGCNLVDPRATQKYAWKYLFAWKNSEFFESANSPDSPLSDEVWYSIQLQEMAKRQLKRFWHSHFLAILQCEAPWLPAKLHFFQLWLLKPGVTKFFEIGFTCLQMA